MLQENPEVKNLLEKLPNLSLVFQHELTYLDELIPLIPAVHNPQHPHACTLPHAINNGLLRLGCSVQVFLHPQHTNPLILRYGDLVQLKLSGTLCPLHIAPDPRNPQWSWGIDAYHELHSGKLPRDSYTLEPPPPHLLPPDSLEHLNHTLARFDPPLTPKFLRIALTRTASLCVITPVPFTHTNPTPLLLWLRWHTPMCYHWTILCQPNA